MHLSSGQQQSWKIEFLDYFSRTPKYELSGIITRFRVTFPVGKSSIVLVVFTEEFFTRYYPAIGIEKLREKIKAEIGLFKKWSLVKIEEGLKKNNLKRKYFCVAENDYEWAKDVESGRISPKSGLELL